MGRWLWTSVLLVGKLCRAFPLKNVTSASKTMWIYLYEIEKMLQYKMSIDRKIFCRVGIINEYFQEVYGQPEPIRGSTAQ